MNPNSNYDFQGFVTIAFVVVVVVVVAYLFILALIHFLLLRKLAEKQLRSNLLPWRRLQSTQRTSPLERSVRRLTENMKMCIVQTPKPKDQLYEKTHKKSCK